MDNFVSNIIIFPQLFHYNIISRLIDACVCSFWNKTIQSYTI